VTRIPGRGAIGAHPRENIQVVSACSPVHQEHPRSKE
jgi:hypothetical protein